MYRQMVSHKRKKMGGFEGIEDDFWFVSHGAQEGRLSS